MLTNDILALDDHTILDRIKGGQVDAFEAIMRRYNQRLFRAARAIVKDDDDAQDVVQEAYIQAFRHLGSFERRARLSTWLTRIVVHEAYRRLRHSQRPSGGADGETRSGEDPEQIAATHEMARVLETAIDSLPPEFRAVFMLRVVEGLDVATAAWCLDIPESTVNTRLHRARHQLRGVLASATDGALPSVHRFLGERCDGMVARVKRKLAPLEVVPALC